MAKKIELLHTTYDESGNVESQEVVHPLTSPDCIIMENGKTLDEVMGDGIATPTLTHEGTSFKVGVGDSNIEVVDGDVAGMTLKGQSYQNILPKPTTLIMETDEQEFKINDKIDSNIIIDDNIAEIATVKGKTIVNAVQEESGSEYTVLGEDLSGQSIVTTNKPEGNIKGVTLQGQTLVNAIQEPCKDDYVVLGADDSIEISAETGGHGTIEHTVHGGLNGAVLEGQTLKTITDGRFERSNNTKYPQGYQMDEPSVATFEDCGMYYKSTVKKLATINVNGEENASCTISFCETIIDNPIKIEKGKTYTLYIPRVDNSNYEKKLLVRDYSQTYNYTPIWHNQEYFVFTAIYDCTNIMMYQQFVIPESEKGKTVSVNVSKRAIIVEGDHRNEKIPLSIGMGLHSVQMPVVKTTGKNLFDINSMSNINNWDTVVSSEIPYCSYKINLKPNTTYTFSQKQFVNAENVYASFGLEKGAFEYLLAITHPTAQYPTTLTLTTDDRGLIYVKLYQADTTLETFTSKLSNNQLQLEEGSTATSYEPYQSSTVTTEKNIFDGILTPDYLTDSTGQPSGLNGSLTHSCYAPSFIPIQANEKFRLRATSDGSTTVGDGRVYFYDKDYNYLNVYVTSLEVYTSTYSMDAINTVPNNSNIAYMRVRFFNGLGVQADSVQINKVYELRKIGDVKDELDLQTGKLTQRIGEVVLNGSEDEAWNTWIAENDTIVWTLPKSFANLDNHPISDRYITGTAYAKTEEVLAINPDSLHHIQIRLFKTTASNINELKTYLQSNPIPIQYQLATPIIKTIDLQVTDQDDNTIPHIQTQPTVTHITASSDYLIPTVTIDNNLAYETIIKPSTLYTVRFKHDTVNTDNPLTVDLGGTVQEVTSTEFTITTPNELTHNQLVFSGKNNVVSEVQVIDGDVTNIEYPFFEGMNDVQITDMTRNVNLFDINDTVSGYLGGNGKEIKVPDHGNLTSNYIKVKPNTTYVYNHGGFAADFADYWTGMYFYQDDKGTESNLYTNGSYNRFVHTGQGKQYSNFKFTTPSDCEYIRIGSRGLSYDGAWATLYQLDNFDDGKFIGRGKNLLIPSILNPVITNSTQNYGGVNFTYNSDGSFTMSGTFTNNITLHGNADEFIKLLRHGARYRTSEMLLMEVFSLDGNTRWTNDLTFDKNNHIRVSPYYQWNGVTGESINKTYYPQIEIGDSQTSYEPYKGVEVQQDIDSIPLTSDMFEQGKRERGLGMSFQQCPLTSNSARISSKTLIPVKPNTKYVVQGITSANHIWGDMYDKDGLLCYDNVYGLVNAVIPHDVHYLLVQVKNADESAITPSDLDSMNLILQEVPQEIVLRGIGDVKDELDLTRGEYIQRIGEIKLADQKNIGSGSKTSETWFEALVYLDDYIKVTNDGTTKIINNKLPLVRNTNLATTSYLRDNASANNYIVAALTVEDMGGLTGYDGWNYYVKNNNVVIQYELETPIIHKVNLTNTKVIPSYATETHYETITPSDSLIPNITIPSTLNYDVAIKPSTQYTIRANTQDNLTVNLGGTIGTLSNGKVTLTTPAALTHNEVKFSGTGKVKELMVVEGNEIKDNVPFFNGMKDVQMGGIKLVNIARGAACSSLVTANTSKTRFTYTGDGTNWGDILFDKSLLKQNTLYTIYLNVISSNSNNANPIKISMGDDLNTWLNINSTGLFRQTFTTNDNIENLFGINFRPCTSGQQVVIQNPMIIEGDWTHLDEIPFIESEMIVEQPIIRSQGKNLLDLESKPFTVASAGTTFTKSGNTYTVTTTLANSTPYDYIRRVWTVNNDKWLKDVAGKKLTLSVSSISCTNSNSMACIQLRIECMDGTKYYPGIHNGGKTVTFNMPVNVKDLQMQIMTNNTGTVLTEDAVLTISGIRLELGDDSTSYEPYKHQTLYSNRVIGYEEGVVYEWSNGFKFSNTNMGTITADVEGLSVAYVSTVSSHYSFWDKDGVFISGKQYLDTSLSSSDKNGFITVPNNAKYMKCCCIHGIETEVTVTGDLPLRSLPNGVCDTLNLVTGEYVQRVGEIVLDGNENWMIHTSTSNLTNCMHFFENSNVKTIKINQIPYVTPIHGDSYSEHARSDDERVMIGGSPNIHINILKERLMTQDVAGFKQYLQQNPITIQYELETPIVRKLGFTTKGNYREQVLDGSETWAMDAIDNDKTVRMTKKTVSPLQNPLYDTPLFTDDYHVRAGIDSHGTYEYIACIGNGIYINFYQSKVNELSVQGCTQWLSHNPIRVGYITSAQSSESYSNIHKPIFFNNVDVQFLPNNVDVQPKLTYQARTRNSYVMDMMKPNTIYTSRMLQSSNGSTFIDGTVVTMKLNNTFTSPSSLTDKLMITPINRQEFMIIEGDVTGKNLPYFKGILSSYHDVDKIELYSVNKNLFDINNLVRINSAAHTTVIGNSITFNCTSSFLGCGDCWIPVEIGEKYTISLGQIIGSNGVSGARIEVRFYNSLPTPMENTTLPNLVGNALTTREKITTTALAKYMRITISNGQNDVNNEVTITNIQVEKSSSATSYIPHAHNTTLIEMPTRLETVKVVRPILVDGALDVTNGTEWAGTTNNCRTDFIPVEPKEFIHVRNGSSDRLSNILCYDINKNFICYLLKAPTQNGYAPENCYFIRLYWSKSNVSDLTITRQAWKPIQLNSLPNGVCDEIIMKPNSNKAQLVQRVGKVIMCNNLTMGIDPSVRPYAFLLLDSSLTRRNPIDKDGLMATINTVVHGDIPNTQHIANNKIYDWGQREIAYFPNSTVTTYEEMQRYTQENPITVYYELTTPIIHEIQLKGYPHVYEDGTVTLNTDTPHQTLVSYNVNQEQLISTQNETIIRHDQQIDDLYYYIEMYLEEIYQMELFRMKLELSL